jgi:hypothetical protein
MAVQPQFHEGYESESTNPGESNHADCGPRREMVTCSQLLPSLFATRNDVGRQFPRFDEHQVDCGDCDIPTIVGTPPAVQEVADITGLSIYRSQHYMLGREHE